MILQGVTEVKCQKCKGNFIERDMQPPCIGGNCLITHRPKTRLNYRDFMLLQKLLDYHATGQMLETDLATRELLLGLELKIKEFIKIMGELEKRQHGQRR